MTPSPHCHRTAPRRSYIYRLMLVTGGDLNDHTILQYISYLSLLDLWCTICAAPGDGFWALCSLLTALRLSPTLSSLLCLLVLSTQRLQHTDTNAPRSSQGRATVGPLCSLTCHLSAQALNVRHVRPQTSRHVTRLQVTSLTSYIAYTLHFLT